MVAESSLLDRVYLLVWTTAIESIFACVCLEIRAVYFAQFLFFPAGCWRFSNVCVPAVIMMDASSTHGLDNFPFFIFFENVTHHHENIPQGSTYRV